MFTKKMINIEGREALLIEGLEDYSLTDTFECGQCFRYLRLSPDASGKHNRIGENNSGYVEYMTVVKDTLVFVGQRHRSELLFFGVDENTFDNVLLSYFALDVDYAEIRRDIMANTDSEFLKKAAECASGIRILRQDLWETLFSFIISQNNNIPRIMGIIRRISLRYGRNLAAERGLSVCPIEARGFSCGGGMDLEMCKGCGACYTFPTPDDVNACPEGLLEARPGFRYKYLTDAAIRVGDGEIDLQRIFNEHSYEYTVSELMKIKGVGEKVASCTSLFAFSNLEAFPIDVWMRRAIDEYFDGNLDYKSLGKYAGVAQQYIFHYIRYLNGAQQI